MKRFIRLLVLFPLLLSLCSCFDYRETEDSYIISAVGFDQTENGVILSLEAANSEKNRVFYASGTDFDEAYENIQKRFAQKTEYGHTACIILGVSLSDEMKEKAMEFCESTYKFSLSARVVWSEDSQKLLECEPYDETVGYDILKILEKNKIDSNVFYKLKDNRDILLPFFEAENMGVALSEKRRRYND